MCVKAFSKTNEIIPNSNFWTLVYIKSRGNADMLSVVRWNSSALLVHSATTVSVYDVASTSEACGLGGAVKLPPFLKKDSILR